MKDLSSQKKCKKEAAKLMRVEQSPEFVLSASKIVKDLLKRKDFNILLNKCLENYSVVSLKFIAMKDRNPYLTEDFFKKNKTKIEKKYLEWFDVYQKELNNIKIDVSIEKDFYTIIFKRRDLLNNSNKKCYILFDDLLSILSAGINLKLDGTFETTLVPATKIILKSVYLAGGLIGISSLNCWVNSKKFSSFCKNEEETKKEDFEKKTRLRYNASIRMRIQDHRYLNDSSTSWEIFQEMLKRKNLLSYKID